MRSREHDPELAALAERFLESPDVAVAPQRKALFTHLWHHRASPSPAKDIWDEALYKLSRAKNKDAENYDYPGTVRKSCEDLRERLNQFFAGATHGWSISLPPALQGVGWQLECLRFDDPPTATELFWQPHLDSPKTSLIYVQQLFFEDMRDGLVFRYFDCNAEHSKDGLEELRKRHPREYKRRAETLTTTYPYVAWGEAEAKNDITQWFDRHAPTQIDAVRMRHLDYDEHRWGHSLILFGAAHGNRFITKVLESYPDLPMTLNDRVRVTLDKPPTEDQRNAIAKLPAIVSPDYQDDAKCVLEFRTGGEYVPIILTRVANPNPSGGNAPVTIFNSHFGSPIHQMAHILTNDRRLTRALAMLNLQPPFPASFQLLCAAPRRVDDDRLVQPLAWRPYYPVGI
jgi:hypothetical protein